MFFDTHNHSQFSFDGGATTVEQSVKAAVDKGFGGICFTDHCDYFVPKMKEEFEPIVCEVFDVKAQQAEIDRVSGLVRERKIFSIFSFMVLLYSSKVCELSESSNGEELEGSLWPLS